MAPSCYVVDAVGAIVVAIGFGSLPGSASWSGFRWNSWLVIHLLGWGAPLPECAGAAVDAGLVQPPADSVVEEVSGLPDPLLFKAKYMSERPVVLRQAATEENGWHLEIFGSGVPAALKKSFDTDNVAAYTDQMDLNTYESMSLEDYERLERSALSNSSRPKPYLHVDITNRSMLAGVVPTTKLVREYHSTSTLHALQLFYGPSGTALRMHMDVADSLFIQIHGRSRWVFVERQYAHLLKAGADVMNMAFLTSPDNRCEALPAGVPVHEAVLNPGDIVYCPAMMFSGSYTIGDEHSLIIESQTVDVPTALKRNWLLSLATLLNPVTMYHGLLGWVNNPNFATPDHYLETRRRAREAGISAQVEYRGRSFFGAYFGALLLTVGVNRLYGTKPVIFLTAARMYQAFGHLLYAFGHGNDFTKFSATEGWGLLCDSTEFLAEGIVFRNKALLGWGCIHFSHWIAQQLAFPQTCLAAIRSQGFAFWGTLMLDNFCNIYAMVYVFQQLLLCKNFEASSQPKACGRSKESPSPGSAHLESEASGALSPDALQQASRGVIALFTAVVVWNLLNES